MANQQVIISVLADVSKFSKRMRSLGGTFADFGKRALLATAVVGAALGKMAFDALKAAEEAQVANARLDSIAESMKLFGDQAGNVSKRLQDYASAQSLATGIDDEAIKATQAKLLTFRELAKSAGVVGGAFDRATDAAIDLAAAGFGEAESNATQLGKALNDPIKGIAALTRVGVTFTKKEKEKIAQLVESGKLLEAQEIILGAIETQVGGTAEATAKSTEKIKIAFEEVSETIGGALLPYVEDLAIAFVEWLQNEETIAFFEDVKGAIETFIGAMQEAFDDPAVKETFDRLNNGIKKFFDYLNSPQGKQDIKNFASQIAAAFAVLNTTLSITLFGLSAIANFLSGNFGALNQTYDQFMNQYFPKVYVPTPSTVPIVADRAGSRGVTVNVSGITPTATIGRTVIDAVNTANRLGVR
jgi:hypothetical protein